MGANIAVASTIRGEVETGLLTGGNFFRLINNITNNSQTWLVTSLILSNYDTTTSSSAISQSFSVTTGYLNISNNYIAFEQAVPPQSSVVVVDSTTPIYLTDYLDFIQVDALGASTGLHYAITYTVLQS